MRGKRLLAWLLLAVLGTACASLPRGFEQLPSYAWSDPQSSELGRFFAARRAPGAADSGVMLLADPREAFRARIALARLAEHTLDLQYYLWKGDLSGQRLLHEVLEAADRGVMVRVLIDDIYHSGRDRVYAALDGHPQVEIRIFNPLGNRGIGRSAHFVLNKGALNHRMHNKLFLVDNAAAIIGGRNIGDDYFGIDPELNFRDLDVLTVGAAAREAGAAYDLYWNGAAAVPIAALTQKPAGDADLLRLRRQLGTVLDAPPGLPYPVAADRDSALGWAEGALRELVWAPTQVVVDPLERFIGGVESALVRLCRELKVGVTTELVAQTAYLIPSAEDVQALAELVARGVRVRMLTNSLLSNNHLVVHAHYMRYRKQLIRAGVELHELRADAELRQYFKEEDYRIADSHAGLHSKAFVFDRETSLIGSFNMDPRSRRWNSEIGLLVSSRDFAARVLAETETDFDPANSYRVVLDDDRRLRWIGLGPEGARQWQYEPGSTLWQRMGARILSWLPIESEL